MNPDPLVNGHTASMNIDPLVSVVMGVYNGANTLTATMDSVLMQEGVAFEFIVIDDGSTDASAVILDDYARRDGRVRVIHQANTGLTRALIRGCAEARGQYIARQDAGDESLPGRLARQFIHLEANPDVVMTSCGTLFVGPKGEFLYEIVQQKSDLQHGLSQLTLDRIRGPSHHGSTMFRRNVYQAAGGYRPQFLVAQDLDLWMRLAEFGCCVATPEVHYQASLTHRSISHALRIEQLRTTKTILKCAAIRRSGGDDALIVSRFKVNIHSPKPVWMGRSIQDARFFYFVGSLLRTTRPDLARSYFLRALQSWFLFPKALIKLLLTKSLP